jgi:hypothetical protein
MFQPQTIDIVYVGSKKFKTDNVCNTGTVWFGYGDVQKVERKHAPKFMAHPDVWLTADEFKKLNPDADSQKLTDSTDDLAGAGSAPLVPAQLTSSETKTDSAPAVVNAQAGLADAPIVAPAAAPDSGSETKASEDGKSEKTDEEKSEKSGEQLAAIKNAILSLEQGNPKHFSTTNGVPVVSAVRNAANNESITAAEVRTAWAELNGKAE